MKISNNRKTPDSDPDYVLKLITEEKINLFVKLSNEVVNEGFKLCFGTTEIIELSLGYSNKSSTFTSN